MISRALTHLLPLVAAAALLSACAGPGGLSGDKKAPPPNVIFILVDDLGYADLGCYGQKVIPTPNLDRMAGEGLRFTQHYAGSTVCAPSRCALMTGKDMGHAYCRGNGGGTLPGTPGERTVAQVFQASGYATALIGKTTVNSGASEDADSPHRNGFDHFFGVVSHTAAHRHYPGQVWRNGQPVKLEGNHERSGTTYVSDVYLDEARGWLAERRKDGRPFFLLLSIPMPHADIIVPDDSSAPFVGKLPDERVNQKAGNYTPSPHVKASFAGMVSRIDGYVGDVLKQLKDSGLDKNTIVCFTSDNGGHLEGGHRVEDFDSNGELRGAKRDLYEGGIRVPLIVRWPAGIRDGRTTDHVSAFWDFLPTVCELTGQPVPPGIQGISYAPTLRSEPVQAVHEALYWEFHELNGRRAVRWGNFKAVQYDVKRRTPGVIEIYDLAKDVEEKHDIASGRPELVAKAIRLFQNCHQEPNEPEWKWTPVEK